MQLTTDKQQRKETPITTGVLDYFPNAIAEVARVSFVGNQQHNPGQPMHWAKDKSKDHADCISRHLLDRGTLDDDGLRHSAKLAWRALALLQIELETEQRVTDPTEREKHVAQAMEKVFGGGVNQPPARPINMGPEGIPLKPDPMRPKPVSPALDAARAAYGIPPGDGTEGALDMQPNGYERMEALEKSFGATLEDHTDPHKPDETRYGQRERDFNRLIEIGCPAKVANQIVGGITYAWGLNPVAHPYVYVAGPMRGLPEFNFPAFDKERNKLIEQGFNVISPADIDRKSGSPVDGDVTKVTDQNPYIIRDFFSIFFLASCNPTGQNGLLLLEGWEKSTGAAAEFFLARWAKIVLSDTFGLATAGELIQNFVQENL
jgi:hypothetical protein